MSLYPRRIRNGVLSRENKALKTQVESLSQQNAELHSAKTLEIRVLRAELQKQNARILGAVRRHQWIMNERDEVREMIGERVREMICERVERTR